MILVLLSLQIHHMKKLHFEPFVDEQIFAGWGLIDNVYVSNHVLPNYNVALKTQQNLFKL